MSRKSNKAGSGSGKPWYKNSLWYFLNSLKLTLFVLITLASTSILGTVVEQNKSYGEYVKTHGEWWADIIVNPYLQLNDMYHSWWFIALLGMLALNIVICTFERFPPKWKSLLHHKTDFNDSFIDRLSNSQTISVNGDSDATKEKVLAAFKKKKFKTEVTGSTGEYKVYAWKGAIGRLGSDVVHISLLVILLGAIVGSFYGYKDFKGIYVGGEFNVPNEDFSVRLDDFWIDYYDTGQIKQYNSELTVLEDGEEVKTKQIWVNQPLYHEGVRFYQSTYGMAWDRVARANIAYMDKSETEPDSSVIIPWDETRAIPGTPYEARLVGYTADFAYDERSGQVFSKSAEANNPAVMIEVYEDGELISTPWLFLNYPGIFPSIPDSDYDLVLVGYRGVMYSGLSINKDPGTNIVWLGTAIMGLGFILAFFVYHRRVWVHISNSANSSEVKIGGIINKNKLVFEKEIKEIVDSVKS